MALREFSLKEIIGCLPKLQFEILGSPLYKNITKLATPQEADESSLIWISPFRTDKECLIKYSKAPLVICDPKVNIDEITEKCFIVTENPKLVFLRIANTLFKKPTVQGIHPTAVIHPKANIGKHVYIGPFAYIGECSIGDGCFIHGQTYLYDNTVIKNNVTVHAGCKIGAEGLNHIINEDGILENFPQIGGVLIEDFVELGADCIVLRGGLAFTKIGAHTKIDCNVVVGHNTVVGTSTLVAAKAVLGGSSVIGNNVFIGINVTIPDYTTIGDHAYLGAHTVIMENVAANTKVVARPPLLYPGTSMT